MKSRISIKVDFEKNTPYILVEDSPSTDTRDELISAFFEKLGYTSSWCRVEFMSYESHSDRRVKIYPITPQELGKEAEQMAGLHKAQEEGVIVDGITVK
jgi:hypothetical protein